MARRSWKTALASSRISNTVALSTQRLVMTTARSRFMSACQCTTSRWCRPSISSTTTSPSGKSHSASRYRHRPAASFRRLCRVGEARPNFLQRCARSISPRDSAPARNVGNRQPQICLMANATNRAHRRIQPCSRSAPAAGQLLRPSNTRSVDRVAMPQRQEPSAPCRYAEVHGHAQCPSVAVVEIRVRERRALVSRGSHAGRLDGSP